jgi:ATP-dependent helicase/nuclease subunit B
MNEGRVPSRASSDSWLPESARELLGLPCEESRAARDAYLLNALLEMRRESGRVDLIVGKSSVGGDVLMPSRLLLTAKGQNLARQVKALFADVEPADSGVAWTLEDHWKWKPREEPKQRMSVTAFSKYLACPFRYYLQRVVGMNSPEPERVEWNNRDFGNVLHDVLEQWGRDETARDSAEVKVIEEWLLKALDDLVARHFGDELRLAVSLQVESMRLRLGWFAERQAVIRAEGWRIVEVEKDFELEIAGATVTGQIDRIEKHEDGRVRVLDYKTSKEAKDVVREHQRKFRDDPPEHLRGEEVEAPGGAIWTNLQVPFYADALGEVDEVGYFALGQDRANVKITPWVGFGEEEKVSARKCAEWIVGQVLGEVFWPPAEKVQYEDFEDLGYGRDLKDAFDWKGETA